MKMFRSSLLRFLLCGMMFGSSILAQSQTNNRVAVGTRTPSETLDVNGVLRVAVLPEDGEQLIFTVNGGSENGKPAASFDQRYTAYRVVTADQNGVLGITPVPPSGFFYMPPVLLPLSEYAVGNQFNDPSIYTYAAAPAVKPDLNGAYTVNLHKLYEKQFTSPQAQSSSSSILPFYPSNNMDFFVTYYDPVIFTDVKLSNDGILMYNVKKKNVNGKWIDITPTEKTFMNIIFRLK